MILKKSIFRFLFLFSIGIQTSLYAQTNPDDIAMVDDIVENNFYEALQQRAVENYDKAVFAIGKCIEKEPEIPAFYYELGKNYLDLKNYPEAESAFKKAISLNDSERWYWNGLYDVYYKTKDYPKSIEVVQKLIRFDANMKEDLVSLYMYTNQKEKALELLNEMERTGVLSKTMEYYKIHLTANHTSNKGEQQLLDAISANPKNEQNYIDLMLFYSQQNQEEKSIEVAKKLAVEIPTSEWAAISLFKLYLNEGNGTEAANAMLKTLKNEKITVGLKHRFLNEFLIFSANSTQFDTQLNEAVDILANDSTINVAKEVAKFYFNKKNFEKATYFLEKALSTNPNDWESIELLLDNLVNAKSYDELAKTTTVFLETFPGQPKLYAYSGLANNKMQKYKDAIEVLETGLEFVVDNVELERFFCVQLIEAYQAIGNVEKSNFYASKLNSLK